MIAILKYGIFTASIEIQEPLNRLTIIRPELQAVTYVPRDEYNPFETLESPSKMHFAYRERIGEDIYLYEFEGSE